MVLGGVAIAQYFTLHNVLRLVMGLDNLYSKYVRLKVTIVPKET